MGYLLKLKLPQQTTEAEAPMGTQIVAIYCICDDLLKGLKHCKDKERQMSDAEVMTTAIVAALFFSGNMEKSRVFLQEHSYMPKMLAKVVSIDV